MRHSSNCDCRGLEKAWGRRRAREEHPTELGSRQSLGAGLISCSGTCRSSPCPQTLTSSLADILYRYLSLITLSPNPACPTLSSPPSNPMILRNATNSPRAPQQLQLLLLVLVFSDSRVDLDWLLTRVGSASRDSDILSQMMSTSRSNTAFTLMFSLADVSKNSKPV
ncbi:hypothetical protein RRG08_061340 [Elysia crispata]|uniref:Uncharacterized protein n=1 Tax=Elysia crispata TaxID=231223 RepID=A0AAE1AFD2_9GAST|nr:hypothetical protein RRG08_061340 [Elysia crispata]